MDESVKAYRKGLIAFPDSFWMPANRRTTVHMERGRTYRALTGSGSKTDAS
jgi:hypothetical protein